MRGPMRQQALHSGAPRNVPRPVLVRAAKHVRSSKVLSVGNGVVTAAPGTVDVTALEAELAQLRAENEQLRRELKLLRSKGPLQAGAAPAAATAGPAAARAGVLEEVETEEEEQQVEVTHDLDPHKLRDALAAGIAWPRAGEDKFWERKARTQPFPLQLYDSADVPAERDAQPMHVVHIAAELAPIGKVGGLGDVVMGLSRACQARGHHVSVIMPFYESLDQSQIEGLKHEMDLEVPKGFRWDGEMRVGTMRTSVFWGRVAGIPVYFIRPADWNACNLFKGGRIYGGSYDDREAYLYLCRASLEFLRASQQQPHIIQVHDWHTAAVSMLYWETYHHEGLWRPRIVLTIHNMENTGECRQDEFWYTGLPGEAFAQADKALDERTIGHNPERLNLMKGGIIYSNAVTTVSPSYASDAVNSGAAGFLRHLFNQDHVKGKFLGILNGVDAAEWDPSCDALLPANFNAEVPLGKALCKEYLQKGLGMAVDPSKPLVAVVSRLVPQKNPGLMAAAAHRCKELGAQFVLLGSGGQDGGLRHMAAHEFRDHPDIRILIMYSEALSHLIYAAADVVLVPSNFEPCGLTQMLAMRYGALPCVRRTGGLADTVRDVDNWQGPEEERNGFTFDGLDAGSLHSALDRAVALFRKDPARWATIAARNMQADVSWAKPAKEYVQLYQSIAQLQ